jgi:hypothetical protein
MMHGHEKSDLAIVAGKLANKAEQSAAELVERRAGTKGNASQQSTHWTQSQVSCVTGAGPHTACLCRHTPEVGEAMGRGGGGCGTFIVHTNRWRLPRAASQRSQPKPGRV